MSAERSQAEIVRRLRLAAAGRREYAATAKGLPLCDVLLAEAATYDSAATIAEGDDNALYGPLPSWRWDEIAASSSGGQQPQDGKQ